MSLLNNIKSNFFSNKNSFSIGFGNRSPLSKYSSAYVPTDYSAPKVPVVSSSPSDWYDPTSAAVITKQQQGIMQIGQNIVKHIKPNIKKDKSKNDKRFNEYYQKQFSDKRTNIEVENWLKYGGDVVDIVAKKEEKRKKDLEEKRQKAGVPTQEELDNIGFTHLK